MCENLATEIVFDINKLRSSTARLVTALVNPKHYGVEIEQDSKGRFMAKVWNSSNPTGKENDYSRYSVLFCECGQAEALFTALIIPTVEYDIINS